MCCVWNDIFALGVPFTEKLIRPVLVYAFLVLALRVAGKRELAQLNTLDFIVLLAVANAVQNGIIGNDNSVTGAWLGATVLFLVNGGLAWLLFRSRRLRVAVEGTATQLITDGKLDQRALDRERLDRDELLVQVEEAGGRTFEEVSSARLEPNGQFLIELRQPGPTEDRLAALEKKIDQLLAASGRTA